MFKRNQQSKNELPQEDLEVHRRAFRNMHQISSACFRTNQTFVTEMGDFKLSFETATKSKCSSSTSVEAESQTRNHGRQPRNSPQQNIQKQCENANTFV